jgi:hypothetical protein
VVFLAGIVRVGTRLCENFHYKILFGFFAKNVAKMLDLLKKRIAIAISAVEFYKKGIRIR